MDYQEERKILLSSAKAALRRVFRFHHRLLVIF